MFFLLKVEALNLVLCKVLPYMTEVFINLMHTFSKSFCTGLAWLAILNMTF